jgi:hypothetical protein
MAQINTGKVIAGGIACAVVLNVVDYLVNGVWLAPHWAVQAAKLNPNLNMMSTNSIIGYVVMDIILAMMIVWLYAAMRPRFGPGARTAMLAALYVWAVSAVFNSMFVVSGMYSLKLVCASSAGSLVGMLAAGYVGGMMYKEE